MIVSCTKDTAASWDAKPRFIDVARCVVGYLLGMPKSMWPNPGRCMSGAIPVCGFPHSGLEGTE